MKLAIILLLLFLTGCAINGIDVRTGMPAVVASNTPSCLFAYVPGTEDYRDCLFRTRAR